jgi:hypothetical protein
MSPIPLGILAAAGASAGPAMEHIETLTVTSTGVSQLAFSNLGSYSTTYRHLQIRGVIGSVGATPIDLRVNADSTLNSYQFAWFRAANNSVQTSQASDIRASEFTYLGTNNWSSVVIDSLDAYVSKAKSFRVIASAPQSLITQVWGGRWNNNASTTSLNIYNRSSTFTVGTMLSIYGLRGE